MWLAVVYQRRESNDINDKGWRDIRGLGAGATVGVILGVAGWVALGVLLWNYARPQL